MSEPSDSILDAFIHIEQAELSRYCKSISIDGVIAQNLTLDLVHGQSLWASRGSLMAYSAGIEWSLRVPGGASKTLSRMMSGEGISLTHVRAGSQGGRVVLTANQPGRLATWDLDRGAIVCTAGSFVAGLGDVKIDVTMARRPGAALFGGGGLFLQRLSGSGIAVVHGSGDFIEHQLGPGEKLVVSTGNLAVFSAEVDYNIRGVGGCIKSLFGGEGLFMTELTGPGWVMLQSLKKQPLQAQRNRSS